MGRNAPGESNTFYRAGRTSDKQQREIQQFQLNKSNEPNASTHERGKERQQHIDTNYIFNKY